MRYQRGFLPIAMYGVIAAGVVIVGLGIALKVTQSRLDSVKAEYAGFVAQTKALGDIAKAKAEAKEKADKELKEKVDAQNKTALATLRADIQRLRNANPDRGTVPAAPTGSKRPDLFAVERSEYQRAYRELVEEIRGLGIEGSEAVINLDSGKNWVKSQVK